MLILSVQGIDELVYKEGKVIALYDEPWGGTWRVARHKLGVPGITGKSIEFMGM